MSTPAQPAAAASCAPTDDAASAFVTALEKDGCVNIGSKLSEIIAALQLLLKARGDVNLVPLSATDCGPFIDYGPVMIMRKRLVDCSARDPKSLPDDGTFVIGAHPYSE